MTDDRSNAAFDDAAIDAAKLKADVAFAEAEASGKWADWRGADPGKAPWWDAAEEWVWTVLEAGGFLRSLTPADYRPATKHVIQLLSEGFYEEELRLYQDLAFGPNAPDMKEPFANRLLVRLMPRVTASLSGASDGAEPVEREPQEIQAAQRRQAFMSPRLLDKGWSNFELASHAGVDHHTIDDYLNGRTKPYKSTFKKIADALGLDPLDMPK